MAYRQALPLIATNYNRPYNTSATAQRLINFYAESWPSSANPGQGRVGVTAFGMPGLTSYATVGSSGVRGLYNYQNTDAYVITGNILTHLTNLSATTPTQTSLGLINSASGRTTWCASPYNQIVFCDGARPYAITSNVLVDLTTVSSFSTSVTAPVTSVVEKDGFFLYLTQTNNTVYVSNVQDAKTVAANSYFQIQSSNDILQAAISSDYYLYFFGQYSTEIWYDAGTAIQPFARQSGGVWQIGTAANNSAQVINENVYFLAQNTSGPVGVVMGNWPQFSVISDASFNAKLANFNSISDAYGWTETIAGHTLYNITFPNTETIVPGVTRGRTYSYDTLNGVWSERQTYNPQIYLQDHHVASYSIYTNGKTIVGDGQAGYLYISSPTAYSDYIQGTTYANICSLQSPTIIDRDCYFTVYNIELDIERGVGLDGAVQGSNPQVMIQWSKDRGNTWSAVITRAIAAKGVYNKRIRIGNPGGGRSLNYRIQISDPIPRSISGLTGEVEREDMSYSRMLGFE